MILNIQDLNIELIRDGTRQPICKNLNFSVNSGETVGILGESGSGKSITALSILQLLPPSISITNGSIDFTRKDGTTTDLTKTTIKHLQSIRGKEISMIFQEPMSSLNPVFTCGSQVQEVILQHQNLTKKVAREQVLELFNKVKLPDLKRIYASYPYQLSGGQIQRVMIAIAISGNPHLLIADEPTTALDVTVQKSILELLKELQAEMNMSILFITHDISVNAEIAHRILVFHQGEIVEQGITKDILKNAQHPYTKKLLECRVPLNQPKEEKLKKGVTKGLKSIVPNNGDNQPSVMKSDAINPADSDSYRDVTLSQKEVSETTSSGGLSIRNLSVSFSRSAGLFSTSSKKQVLHNINLQVFKGETLGLVGESGSGKTTLGRTIMKLIETESGEIEFHGKALNAFSPKELKAFRKKVQIVFQDPYSSLNPKITVGSMIAEPLQVHKICKNSSERKQRVMELLTQVNLQEEHYYRYPHQFSGGQRQRIGIARALAVEPEIIILDESVSALDVSIQAQILTLLNDLKKAYNLTYIFISHDLNIVRYMSDRIIVLKDGAIVEEGSANDVFNSPKNPYTANLIASIPGN